jgi:hypothetical protein
VTSRARRVVGVFTADCVPVLLASADGRRVAAVHAGWRGLVAGVIPRALEALVSNEPSASVRELAAAIGPCLSLARFEVGTEVAEQFALAGLADAVRGDLGEKPHVDLRAAAAMQLERAGVARIDATDRCTWEQAGDFPSHRRDVTHGGRERAGRLLALVSPRAG